MKIYPIDYIVKDAKAAPTENDPVAVAAVRAFVKAEMTKTKKGGDVDHYVGLLAEKGLLAGIVDIYAVLKDGKSDWQVPEAAAAEPVVGEIVEK